MQQYKHTQFGTVVAAGLAAGMVVTISVLCVLLNAEPAEQIALGILAGTTAVLFVCLLLFYRLTVEVTDESVTFRFGVGLIAKSIPLARISTCKPVKTRFWHGWGIHYYGKGWLYNVAGFRAVEITLESGKQLRIGTDEPETLCGAIDETIAHRR